MDLDGNIYVVPGFHDEWIQSHPEHVGSIKSVTELIMKLRWVSVVVYSKGYIELCINDATDPAVIALVFAFLKKNLGKWTSVLIMPMVEEGFIQAKPEDLIDEDSFRAHLIESLKKTSD